MRHAITHFLTDARNQVFKTCAHYLPASLVGRTPDPAGEEDDTTADKKGLRFVDRLPTEGYLLKLTDEIEARAQEYDVVPDIHFEDYVFNATYEYYKKDFDFSAKHYYLNGNTSAVRVRELSDTHLVPTGKQVRTILDFASGYGCVSRHLKNLFPDARAVPMDIHEKAYWFNRQNLGLEGRVSKPSPQELDLSEQFDIVFALSFFSHMPDHIFATWMQKLAGLVSPGGMLIFTTHGETSHKTQMPHIEIDERGYGFIFESEQFDLPTSDYGHAVSYAPYVRERIAQLKDMTLVAEHPGLWWTHQDTYVLLKTQ